MDRITVESMLSIPAAGGMAYNDVLSLLSVIGCGLMFLAALFGARLRRLGQLGEWGIAPLIFGTLFQISFMSLGLAPETEKIGFIVPMPPGMINGLFLISFLLLAGRWWLRRGQYSFARGPY